MRRIVHHDSAKLLLLLVTVIGVPATVLVALGLVLRGQEASLREQRQVERRKDVLHTAVRSLEASLADVERRARAGERLENTLTLTLTDEGVTAEPRDGVLWLPRPVRHSAVLEGFAAAEVTEFGGNAAAALAFYEGAATSHEVDRRAAALVRVARLRRRHRQWDDALRAYEALASVSEAYIEGAPADLQARRATCDLLASLHRREALDVAVIGLERDVLAGRWTLDRAAWELTAADIARWRGSSPAWPASRRAASLAAERLWQRFLDKDAPPAREAFASADEFMLALAGPSGTSERWTLVTTAQISAWAAGAAREAGAEPSALALMSNDGHVLGRPSSSASDARATAAETGLPWTVVLWRFDDPAIAVAFTMRSRLLSTGLVAILLLIAGGAYFLWRVLERELAIARLQKDFVAGISHELRTPLTALRHVTELLCEDDDLPRERRVALYDVLGRNTDRLNRLVDSVLDFSRAESGRSVLNLQPIDVRAVVTDIVADFRKANLERASNIRCSVSEDEAPALADCASLASAVWNLLDNAVKYSGGGDVTVSVTRRPVDSVAIAVEDTGIGIPAAEQQDVFNRFVRGARARDLGIRGTGLGLALVSDVAAAHDGHVELASREGVGSTFTIVLPEVH